MADQTVVWTALPHGATGEPGNRRLRLSVFVSPRLISAEPQPTLALFGDFLAWPRRLADGQVVFTVQARETPGGPSGPPVLATIVSSPPDPDLWTAVFSPSTPVESHRADGISRLINTYSVAAVHDQLKQGHQAFAMDSPLALPGRAALGRHIPAFAAFGDMDGERVIPSLVPEPDVDDEALHQVLRGVAANMFRADNSTDVAQRVSAAISHARELARRNTDVPLEVIPRTFIAGTDTVNPASDLARVMAFTRGPTLARPQPPTLAGTPPAENRPASPQAAGPLQFDFHHYLAFLADHPALMRLLGLIIDLEIPVGSVPLSPSAAPDPRLVQVLPAFTAPLQGQSVSPYTAYRLEGQGERFFAAAPAAGGPEILHGLLNLKLGGEYELVQVDVQGGALKLINALASPAGEAPPESTADGGGLPAMRTSGVSIVRADHARRYVERMGIAADNNATLEAAVDGGGDGNAELPVLFAEDLTRGYRFDVFDVGTQRWRSLHERVGTYTFREHPGGPISVPVQDEGMVHHAATQPQGGDGHAVDTSSELYIHESLLHWQGWSLSTPRPGKTVADDGPATVTSSPPPGGPQLDVTVQARPGSLPRLRFGNRYRFRARSVDLAGNGPSLDEATALLDTVFPTLGLKSPVLPAPAEDFTYCRFEPVVSPVLVPRARLTEGETQDRLVIRTRAGTGATREADDLTAIVAAARPDSPTRYQPTCERHLVPPKISQHLAETHGLFDAAFGTQTGFHQTYTNARKEKGRLTDIAVLDTDTGELVALPDPGAVEVIPTNPSSRDGYVIHREARLALPYLPDPLARGATLCGLPGVPRNAPAGFLDGQGHLAFGQSTLPADVLAQLAGSTVHIPFTEPGDDRWPDRLPFRLVVAERTPATGAQPTWDGTARVLTVFLSAAEQRTVRLSSFIMENDLNQLGQWHWLLDASPGGTADPVAVDAAAQGGRWQLTPGRTLTLVHAVEQPLLSPEIKALSASRDPAATYCFLAGRLAAHGDSTAKIDLLASWEDVIDPPGTPAIPATAPVFDIPIHQATEDSQDPAIVPVATYDPDAQELSINGPSPDDESGRTYLARHEFGDTRHRTVRYSATATSRFREYFPSEVADDASRLTVTAAAVEVNVPSSSRPAPPGLVSAMPTFTWRRETRPDSSFVSTRTGGVRLYLRRPWYSSGGGELLAVVLAEPADYPPADFLRPFVTHWGRDPIWGQIELLDPPAPSAFAGAVRADDGQVLDEAPEVAVFAVAHEVAYDPGRDLLVCDVAVDPTPQPYYPFVRLALARYQPDSLPGRALSRVALADFVQVAPRRTVTVTPGPAADTFLVDVQGFNPIHSPFIALVRVSVEQRIPGVTDDDLGWSPVPDDMPGITIDRTVVNQTPTLWRGQVTLPGGREPGQFRVVIREVEPLPTDDSQGSPSPEGRLVFAETIIR